MDLRKRDWQALTTWLFTIVLLAGGFGLYSYLYVERREQYFTEKKLRELRLVGDQIKLRVDNIANNVLPNAIRAAKDLDESDCEGKQGDPDLNAYTYVSSVTNRVESHDLCATLEFLTISSKTKLVPNFTLEKFVEYQRIDPTVKEKNPPGVTPRATVEVWPDADKYTLLFTYLSGHRQGDRYSQKWRGRIAVDQLVGQFVTESFDQLVVADQYGEVKFQIGATQLGITNLRSLVERAERVDKSGKPEKEGKPGEEASPGSAFASARDATSVVSVKLAGEEYLLFFQPVRVSLPGASTADQQSLRFSLDWRIVGIISRERFRRDSSTFSYTTIVMFLFLLLLVVFAEPFIKIASLGPLDRLRKRDVVFLFISAALTTALLTIFVSYLYAYGQLAKQIDSQLTTLAGDIQYKFGEDLSKVLGTLKNLSEMRVPSADSSAYVNLLETPTKESGDQSNSKCKDIEKVEEKPVGAREYPDPCVLKREFFKGAFFERIVWVDPRGMQRRKWTIYDTNTPLIPVEERPYFQRVKNAQLWKKTVGGREICFWLGPIVSWNTGERLATFSVRGPTDTEEDLQNDASCVAHPDQSSHWVITLDAVLPSLRNVVLPPGYGFVVVDHDGTELFHSDPARHLQENFFEESDQEPALRGAVFGRATEFFNADYLGKGHRMHTIPFDAPPWTLVVFYDKHYIRTSNVEILCTALALFLILLVLQLPALAILWFRDPQWLWFSEKRRDSYPTYLLGLLGLVILFLVAIVYFSPVTTAFAAFLVPSVTLSITYFNFRPNKSERGAEAGTWDCFLSFGPVLILLLVLFYWCVIEQRFWEGVVISVGTILCGLFIFHSSVKRQMKSITWLPSTRSFYVLTIGALLFILGILPALAFFRISYKNEMVLLLKHGQYHLAESLQAREERLRKETLKIPGGKSYFIMRTEENSPRDVYQDFFFPCPSDSNPSGRPPVSRSAFGYVLKEIRLRMLFDPVVIESQGLLHDDNTDNSRSWLGGDANCIYLLSRSTDSATSRPRPVEVRSWWKPISFKWFVVLVLMVLSLLKVIVFMTKFIADRIFLIGTEVPSKPSDPPALADFDTVWEGCSHEEKVALYDFAADAFLNSQNQSIASLLERGLFRLDPFRLANEAFRKLILAKGGKDEDLVPGKEENLSGWQKMKWPLLVGLLGIAIFLFFSQRKIFEGGVGFLGALAGAVAAFFNLFDQVRGTRR